MILLLSYTNPWITPEMVSALAITVTGGVLVNWISLRLKGRTKVRSEERAELEFDEEGQLRRVKVERIETED